MDSSDAGHPLMDHFLTQLDTALTQAVRGVFTRVDSQTPALLYSAGVDSALLAKLCQELGHRPLLLSVGTVHSKDRAFIERSRSCLDLPLRFLTITEEEIVEALPFVQKVLREAGIPRDRMHLSLGVGTWLAARLARQHNVDLLLSGQGADALFAGFQKYQRIAPGELPDILRHDVKRARAYDFTRDQAIAAQFAIPFSAPFLDPAVVEVGLAVPTELKLSPAGNKWILRTLAQQKGLPDFIALRPKKAMQYSTGIERVVRKMMVGR